MKNLKRHTRRSELVYPQSRYSSLSLSLSIHIIHALVLTDSLDRRCTSVRSSLEGHPRRSAPPPFISSCRARVKRCIPSDDWPPASELRLQRPPCASSFADAASRAHYNVDGRRLTVAMTAVGPQTCRQTILVVPGSGRTSADIWKPPPPPQQQQQRRRRRRRRQAENPERDHVRQLRDPESRAENE